MNNRIRDLEWKVEIVDGRRCLLSRTNLGSFRIQKKGKIWYMLYDLSFPIMYGEERAVSFKLAKEKADRMWKKKAKEMLEHIFFAGEHNNRTLYVDY